MPNGIVSNNIKWVAGHGSRSPAGRGGQGAYRRRCRSSTISPHRLRRGALHLPARRSRQNANLFLREPLGFVWIELQDCNVGQVSVTLVEVESVTNHKMVWYFEADIVRGN